MVEVSEAPTMRAIVADPALEQHMEHRAIPRPEPANNEVLVRVKAISLNSGDTRMATSAEEVFVPGWDFSGVIEIPAADGSSPPRGTRVVGVTLAGAWAEYVRVRSNLIAPLPDSVSFAQAAALPVAAVTALLAMRECGDVCGKRLLITGAAGGVGRYACQMASQAGAEVYAMSRRSNFSDCLKEDNVSGVHIVKSIDDAVATGDFDAILESVGGQVLATALGALNPNGICVSFGNSLNTDTCLNIKNFYMKGGVILHGLYLGQVLASDTGGREYLAEVVNLVAIGKLHSPIGMVLPWTKIMEAATLLQGQRVDGKIILDVEC